MFRLIRKIQKQPDYVKKNVALLVSVLIMVPIFFLWFSTVSLSSFQNVAQEEMEKSEARSFFEETTKDFGSVYNGVRSQIGALGRVEIDMGEE